MMLPGQIHALTQINPPCVRQRIVTPSPAGNSAAGKQVDASHAGTIHGYQEPNLSL
jgi:hypothetical protein